CVADLCHSSSVAIGVGSVSGCSVIGTNSSYGTASVTLTYTASNSTSTTVGCAPGTVAVGQSTTCTATVTADNGTTTPTSTVTFSSTGSGGSFPSGNSCDLASTTAGQASCSVTYAPEQVGSGSET